MRGKIEWFTRQIGRRGERQRSLIGESFADDGFDYHEHDMEEFFLQVRPGTAVKTCTT